MEPSSGNCFTYLSLDRVPIPQETLQGDHVIQSDIMQVEPSETGRTISTANINRAADKSVAARSRAVPLYSAAHIPSSPLQLRSLLSFILPCTSCTSRRTDQRQLQSAVIPLP